MSLKAEVKVCIQKPLEEVFDALYNPEKLMGFFTTKQASAKLDEGTTVTWEFADHPGPFPVKVLKSEKNKQIILGWEAGENAGYNTTTTFTYSELNSSNTLVHIVEEGWKDETNELPQIIGNAQGWMHMACCMKAYLEYGINLRKGFFN